MTQRLFHQGKIDVPSHQVRRQRMFQNMRMTLLCRQSRLHSYRLELAKELRAMQPAAFLRNEQEVRAVILAIAQVRPQRRELVKQRHSTVRIQRLNGIHAPFQPAHGDCLALQIDVILEARIGPPDATKVSLGAAGATQAGGILAVGGGVMTDGSIQRFIAKTDLTGRTVQSVHTGQFLPRQVCEATDGTVWTLGYPLDYRDSADADKNILRHYSFEKGLLESFVTLDSISKSADTTLSINAPGKSFLRCSKDHVSVLFGSAAQYVEVDTSNGKLARWNVALPPIEELGDLARPDSNSRVDLVLLGGYAFMCR